MEKFYQVDNRRSKCIKGIVHFGPQAIILHLSIFAISNFLIGPQAGWVHPVMCRFEVFGLQKYIPYVWCQIVYWNSHK